MGSIVDKTCNALKRYGFPIEESGKLLRPQNPKFDRVCRNEFQKAAQKLGEACVLTADDIQITHQRLVQLGMWSRERGVQALFKTTKFGSGYAYNSASGKVEIAVSQCRSQSRVYLEYILDHEVGHCHDDKVPDSLFPDLKKWRAADPIRRNAAELCNRYKDVLLRQVPEEKRQSVRDALVDFLYSKLGGMKSEPLGERLVAIQRMLAETLRYGEEVYDDRLKQLVLEEDFSDLFKKPPPDITLTPAQKQTVLMQQKSARAPVYLYRVLSAAQLEEAGVMEIFRKQPFVDQDILNSLDRRHIDLFRLLIRAASRYFPTIGEHPAVVGP